MTPGYPPHHPGLRPSQSSMSRGTPGGASVASSVDDDKGRGSYKCGRCGVPKKGHICPYQPKAKRKADDPIPEMKCVSTQVEMDEFMTLRRLNIEIQGFPESYAAEPTDNCGADVRPPPPPPPQHHASMTLSSQHGPPPAGPPPGIIVKPGVGPTSHPSRHPPPAAMSMQHGPPTSLPSLSSMQSHPRPNTSIASMKQPEQTNSSAAPVKTEATTSSAHASVSAEDLTTDEIKPSHTEERTNANSIATNKEGKPEPQDDNKNVVEVAKEMKESVDNATISDGDTKKRGVSEEKSGHDTDSLSKKQKV